jgi:hypothetical protein
MGSADAVAQYEAASANGDIDALMKTLAPDAELISPIVANAVIRGHSDIRVVMEAVYATVHDLKWREGFGDDHRVLMIGEAKVGPFRIGDAAIIELAEDGSIRRISATSPAMAGNHIVYLKGAAQGIKASGRGSTVLAAGTIALACRQLRSPAT